jgi:nitroreductase
MAPIKDIPFGYSATEGTSKMDLLEPIQNRRSIRKYKKDPVEEEKLQKVLKTCRAAPSSHNGQPWKLVIRRKKTLKAISKETAYGTFLAEVPMGVAIVLDPKESQTFHMADGGILTQNFAGSICPRTRNMLGTNNESRQGQRNTQDTKGKSASNDSSTGIP